VPSVRSKPLTAPQFETGFHSLGDTFRTVDKESIVALPKSVITVGVFVCIASVHPVCVAGAVLHAAVSMRVVNGFTVRFECSEEFNRTSNFRRCAAGETAAIPPSR
jgi:hypothetical protein